MMNVAEMTTRQAAPSASCAAEMQRQMAVQLAMEGIDSAALDARLLMQKILGCNAVELVSHRERTLTPRQQGELNALLERRLNHEPMAYIIGEREFWDANFKVTQDTLIPRPDSETLIEAVLKQRTDKSAPLRIIDLGTGSGCLLVSLLREYKHALGTGVDVNPKTLKVAEENAMRNDVEARTRFVCSDWWSRVDGQYDIIISNPPYIERRTCDALERTVRDYEPRGALDGGEDGLHCYRTIAERASDFIARGGLIAVEIGQGQETDVNRIFSAAGFHPAGTQADLAGIVRVCLFTLSHNKKD